MPRTLQDGMWYVFAADDADENLAGPFLTHEDAVEMADAFEAEGTDTEVSMVNTWAGEA